jgi:UDP-N-acetylglucosamine diphosphorylase/glucosamine-1-phosphate N-acetyltransferase
MENIVLFDHPTQRLSLAPLTLLRPIAEIPIGIFTIQQKWERRLKTTVQKLSEPFLSQEITPCDEGYLYIHGGAIPTDSLIEELKALAGGDLLVSNSIPLAFKSKKRILYPEIKGHIETLKPQKTEAQVLQRPWEIFQWNKAQIEADFSLLDPSKNSGTKNFRGDLYGADNVYFESGVETKSTVIDAENGLIYSGQKVSFDPGSVVVGSHSFGANTKILSNANLKGDSSFGTYCKAGGEISNSVFFDYSNKGHDGFIGNAVVGSWCNLGAMTTCSNLKNNYSTIRVHSYLENGPVESGLQFCGLIMGDHSKTAIGSLFNTATVVGIAATLFGSGFHPKFVPSFSWGGPQNDYVESKFDKVIETAKAMMDRRHVELSERDELALKSVFEKTKSYR